MDTVIHMAAIVSTVAPLDVAWEVNVMGARKVLEAAKAATSHNASFSNSASALQRGAAAVFETH